METSKANSEVWKQPRKAHKLESNIFLSLSLKTTYFTSLENTLPHPTLWSFCCHHKMLIVLKLAKRSLSSSSSSKLLLEMPTNTAIMKCLKFPQLKMEEAGSVLRLDYIQCFQLEKVLVIFPIVWCADGQELNLCVISE